MYSYARVTSFKMVRISGPTCICKQNLCCDSGPHTNCITSKLISLGFACVGELLHGRHINGVGYHQGLATSSPVPCSWRKACEVVQRGDGEEQDGGEQGVVHEVNEDVWQLRRRRLLIARDVSGSPARGVGRSPFVALLPGRPHHTASRSSSSSSCRPACPSPFVSI